MNLSVVLGSKGNAHLFYKINVRPYGRPYITVRDLLDATRIAADDLN